MPDGKKELLMQVAVYAEIPAANAAFAVAKKVYAELPENTLSENNKVSEEPHD